MSDEWLDALRNLFFFLWLCSFMPSAIFAGSSGLGLGIGGTEKMEFEIRAFRLQQFESAGKMHGSKAWKVLYEAVSLKESALRKCMVLKWRDLLASGVDFEDKFSGAIGAVLVVIPADAAALSEADRQAFLTVEQKFGQLRTELAVYFAPDSPSLQALLKSVALSAGRAKTAVQQLLNTMVADNFQIGSASSATSNLATAKVHNVVAQLNAAERAQPYLFIVAHYDTYGVIPGLTTGADSNGSGMAVLLELLAIFSRLYAIPSHRARFNLVFVLSAGGKFSYQGSRSFIDDFNERYSDETIALSVCLDGLAKGAGLYVHAAKTPTAGTSASKLVGNLRQFSTNNRSVELRTKKINLSTDRLAWEHEIYNIRRIHSLTISHFESHTDSERNTVLDTPAALDVAVLEQNANTIANSLVAFVFDMDARLCESARLSGVDCAVLNDAIRVDRKRLHTWLNMFASKPRPIVVPQQQLVANLHEVVKRHAHTAHTTEVAVNDFVLYEIIEDTLTANIVKPAIFELLLAAGICAYLYALYFLAQNAQLILEGGVIRIRKLVM